MQNGWRVVIVACALGGVGAGGAAFAQGAAALACEGVIGAGPNEIGGKNPLKGSCGKDDQLGPLPSESGPCNCMVYLDTSNRRIIDSEQRRLFQECNGHFGHGSCPTGPACSDAPHSSPYGNWGVRFKNATAQGVANTMVSGLSRLQDCMQWRGTKRDDGCGLVNKFRCFQWHTCTCDDNLDPAHFDAKNPQKAPPPQFLSAPSARAGWFRVDTRLAQCGGLQGASLAVSSDMDLFELDGTGGSDLVARLRAAASVPLSCKTPFACEGQSERFTLGAGPVSADARFIVLCRSPAPRPPSGGGGGGPPPPSGNKRCGERCNSFSECGSGFCDASNHCTKRFLEESCLDAD